MVRSAALVAATVALAMTTIACTAPRHYTTPGQPGVRDAVGVCMARCIGGGGEDDDPPLMWTVKKCARKCPGAVVGDGSCRPVEDQRPGQVCHNQQTSHWYSFVLIGAAAGAAGALIAATVLGSALDTKNGEGFSEH